VFIYRLGGGADAAIKGVGEGGGGAERLSPIATITLTKRVCDLNALPRIRDERYCDKYYVCSSGLYVGLSCPCGMAFDYGIQECRLRKDVDCAQLPYFSKTTKMKYYTSHSRAGSYVLYPITFLFFFFVIVAAALDTVDDCHGSAVEKLPTAIATTKPKPVTEQHVTVVKTTMIGQPDVLILPLGAKVMIPFGTTLLLPPGSQIQTIEGQKEMSTTTVSPLVVPSTSVTSNHHHDQDVTIPSSSENQQNSTTSVFTDDPDKGVVTIDYDDDYGSDDDNTIATTEFDPLPRS